MYLQVRGKKVKKKKLGILKVSRNNRISYSFQRKSVILLFSTRSWNILHVVIHAISILLSASIWLNQNVLKDFTNHKYLSFLKLPAIHETTQDLAKVLRPISTLLLVILNAHHLRSSDYMVYTLICCKRNAMLWRRTLSCPCRLKK